MSSFAAIRKDIDALVDETTAKYSPCTSMVNAFKEMRALEQAKVFNYLSDEHFKTVKKEMKESKGKKEKDPDAPKREDSDWIRFVKLKQQESGYKYNENGEIMKKKDGEPAYNLDYNKALIIASVERQKLKEQGLDIPKKTVTNESRGSVTSSSARVAMTEPAKAAKVVYEPDAYEEETTWELWPHPTNGKLYWKTKMDECWNANPKDHTRGAWVGIYNRHTRKFDMADEPEVI